MMVTTSSCLDDYPALIATAILNNHHLSILYQSDSEPRSVAPMRVWSSKGGVNLVTGEQLSGPSESADPKPTRAFRLDRIRQLWIVNPKS